MHTWNVRLIRSYATHDFVFLEKFPRGDAGGLSR